ncbi:MAG: hypothetical protein J6Q52_03835 [Clostridia bacterium]|nr:hypothetical protein [Clostridia bacterium]
MNILSIISIALISVIIINLVSKYNPDFSIIATVVAGIILLVSIVGYFTDIVDKFEQIVSVTGINDDIFSVVLKVVGLSYITQFSADICKDFGVNSIAQKVELAGKIAIFTVALPIVSGMISIVMDLL